MPLLSRFTAQLIADHSNVPGTPDLAVISAMAFPLRFNRDVSLADGTGAGNADRLFSDRRSTSGNDDLDLAGVLTDAFGVTLTFARIKAIMIAADPANPGNITVGAGTNPLINILNAAGTLTIPAGGFNLWSCGATALGATVTAGTGDILRVNGSGGSCTYDIAIVGASA